MNCGVIGKCINGGSILELQNGIYLNTSCNFIGSKKKKSKGEV